MAFGDNKNQKENFIEIGRQFAYEGLDESYLKDDTPEDLAEFRKGFEEVSNKLNSQPTRSEEFVLDNESRSMHR